MRKIILFLCILFVSNHNFAQSSFVKLDIATGSASASPRNFFEYNGKLYFSAFGPFASGIGNELYSTDGTQAGTQLVANTNPDFNQGSSPENFALFNNELYFSATTSVTGKELYKTNGTTVSLVKNIGATTSSGIENTNYIELNGFLYFFAQEQDGAGYDLWRTDGTSTGTTKVASISSTSVAGNPLYFKRCNNELYFLAQNINDNTVGIELYKYSPVSNTVSLVVDIFPNNGQTSTIGYSYFTVFDNKLFFVADAKLRFTDGTTTQIVTSGASNITAYFEPKVFQNQVIFIGNSTNNGNRDIYKCSLNNSSSSFEINLVYNFTGTSNLPIENVSNDGIDIFTELNNKLYFAARESTSPNNGSTFQIYETNGTATSVVVPITHTGSPTSRRISFITALQGKLYYISTANNSPEQLWQADPTTGAYIQLTNFIATPNIPEQISERPMAVFNNALYFEAQKSGDGTELWKLTQTVLPATCMNFYHSVQTNMNKFVWIVNNEINTNHFEIQESFNGVRFYTIGKVAAAGNTSQANMYQFLARPRNTGAIYRLKQVDKDGSFMYLCRTLQVQPITNVREARLLPNITSNSVIIELPSNLLNAEIIILNTHGQKIYAQKAISQLTTINVLNWQNGSYYVSISKNGINKTLPLLVQH